MLDNQDRENLTAYLDGELDENSQALEAKINLDPQARQEVDALKQAWGMLDYLPKAQPSTTFTERTMERLSLEKMGRANRTAKMSRHRATLRMVGWVAALVAAGGVGLGAGHLFFSKARHDAGETLVKDAQDKNGLPAVYPELRDQEWMTYQPKAVRDQYARLPDEVRPEFVKKLHLEERQRAQEWQIARRFWKELDKGTQLPSRLTDFPAEVSIYVTEYLRPVLSKEEGDQLAKAQGQWPLYPLTLVELADSHPPALPGLKGPKSFAELPAEVKNRLRAKGIGPPKKLKDAEKRWPDFGIAVTVFAAAKKNVILPHELWPWGHSCLSPPMQEFVDKKLVKVLDSDEKLRLIGAEGKWPEYAVAIQELARNHNLQVPWQTLPGPRERWENYRNLKTD